MKKVLLVSILLFNLVFIFGQKSSLKEFAEKEGLTTVALSKSMLSLFPKDANLSYGGVKVGEFLDKLSSINIIISPKGDIAKKLVSFATNLMETPDYDKLMEINTEKDENAMFFVRGTEQNISELVLIVQGNTKESAVMQFFGNFTLEDIQKMIENGEK